MRFLGAWFVQAFIAFDQLVNAAVLPLLTWSVGYADETLSARCWRESQKGARWGLWLLPVIDWMFSWQEADPAIKDEHGNVVTAHCHRAFLKERLRRNLPPEYR